MFSASGDCKVNVTDSGLFGDRGIEITENAEVSSISSGSVAFNAFYGPVTVENSSVTVSNCGFGFSGSEANLKDSAIEVSSNSRAFLVTPTLDYSTPVAILAGETADSATKVAEDSADAATYQSSLAGGPHLISLATSSTSASPSRATLRCTPAG